MKRKLFLVLLFIASMVKASITTPYPATIELSQINSAEKERVRLCQGQKKYDRQPTGFYVEAGKKLEVNVEILTAADAGVMPKLTVGTLGFNVNDRNTGVTFTLQAGVNTITNHSGGLIWLSFVTDAAAEPKGRARITFTANSEQVRAPRYVYGVTTNAEFSEMMTAYQTPDVVFHSDYIAVAATREAAQQYSVNENKNAWMESIHALLEKEDEISGMDNSDANPLHHRLKTGEVRFLLVENTSANPHAASSGYTGYPQGSRARYLTKLGTSTNNSWMLGHELGHQHQQPAYQINLSTESTVNIYSYAVERYFYESNNPALTYNRTTAARWTQAQNSYLALPLAERIYDMDSGQLESITGFNRDELRFMPWEQLFLIFGDQFYKTLHRVVREEKVTGGGADERRFYLIWKASQVSGYDLTEFFNQWGIRLTDATLKASLRARMTAAKTKGDILDLSSVGRTPEELIRVTGQAKPVWTPLTLRGITSSSVAANGNLDRSNWRVTTNIQGPPDATVGGDRPEYIIDGNTTTAFLFVKPRETLAPVTAPANYLPTFVINMMEPQSFNYVKYAHRSADNTSINIRAWQLSVYGSIDSLAFTPIVEHYAVDYVKNDNEITLHFPMVTYRYIKVVIEDWNRTGGKSVQVAEFNAGIDIVEAQLPTKNEVAAVAERVNDYWIANHAEPGDNKWTKATYFTGDLEFYKVFNKQSYLDYALLWANNNNWTLNDGVTTAHADNHAAGQVYIDLYSMDEPGNPAKIAAIKSSIDSRIANNPASDDWWWIDAMFMAMPTIARLGVVCNDDAYFNKLYALFRHTRDTLIVNSSSTYLWPQAYRTLYGEGPVVTCPACGNASDGLYNKADGLWYRDWRYQPGVPPGKDWYSSGNDVEKLSPDGKNIYWSRGNGWVIAAMARTLQVLPETEAHRGEYISMFTEMANALKNCQSADGCWNMNLADPNHYPAPETSGTAFFTFALAWGINNGLLDRATYYPVVAKAWNGLVEIAIQPDGNVQNIQNVQERPVDPSRLATESVDFGVGAVLLAATEVIKLADGELDAPVNTAINRPAASPVSLYPGRIKAGQAFYVDLNGETPKGALAIYSISGVCQSVRKIYNRITECIIEQSGIYLVVVKLNTGKYRYKVIVG
jgi:rhamnogalacturonyl hydrolase YesR